MLKINNLSHMHFGIVILQLSSNEELEVLSVLAKDSGMATDPRVKYCLVPSTQITFIGWRYRYVFYLDVSPSLATVVSFIKVCKITFNSKVFEPYMEEICFQGVGKFAIDSLWMTRMSLHF